nr:RNA-dependent RNA polymerase [Narnavirus sp.]
MEFPTFWAKLCPWLVPLWYRGLQSKFECTRLAHFLTSRNLPAGSKMERKETLAKHAEVLCGEAGPDQPGRRELLYHLARHAGEALSDKRTALSAAHVSITNSASFDSPLNIGGRARDVSRKFREWVSEVPTEDFDGTTWFGKRYWLKAGVPRWRTMCREEVAKQDGRPGDSALIDEVDFTPGKYRYEDPLYCLDKFTGYQLLQWSIEEAIAQKALVGTPYRSGRGIGLGRPAAIRASAIGEPGGKSRVVTVGEDWLTILLQPLSHGLISILREDPSARAGLSRGWQGFEYTKSWSSKDGQNVPPPDERFILTSDLKTATDYCPHGYAKALLRGFIDGLGVRSAMTDLWVEVLVSPRIYVGPVEEWSDTITQRGVLMGDPGAKLVLSLFNKTAEMEAMLRYSLGMPKRASCQFLIKKLQEAGVPNTRFRLFAFAGDDHIAIGPPEYLKEITRSHIRNGMKVSESSNYISPIAGFYCEELIFIRQESVWKAWGLKVPLVSQPYEDNPHVDALKVRLLSLCQKEHEGKNETNPAIGMSSTLRGMLAWFAEGWEPVRTIATYRFHQKMRHLLPQNLAIRGLPRNLGGVEAPLFGYTEEQIRDAWNSISIVQRRAICLARRPIQRELQPIRRILAKASLATSARGIDLDSIEEEVRSVLSSELCQAREVDSFRIECGKSELEWGNLRLWEKMKCVSALKKFLPVSEALQVVMRPYIFRDLLFPEESIAHGIDPYRKRAYRQLAWPNRLKRLDDALVETINQSQELKAAFLSVSRAEEEENREDIISSMFKPYLANVPKEVLMIPREVVYTDNLCTMATPDIH